ncbi:endonuclease/exonuclease/phosphatase family protein [Tabrizicola sp.]|uniref:endonuclease/exonuclease/phosphatase family protein n=1 Tax=Tabrizicola sp. TaxID=2005166 RepID=UPI003F4016EC
MIRFASILALCAAPAGAETLRVMSYNIWGGGANEGKGIEETLAAIKAAGADVVGLQETRLESDPCTAESCPAVGDSIAPALAEALGWYVYDQTAQNGALWANAVISRYPIGAASANDLGVPLDVNGKTVWLFNIHLDDEPYQPYQLLNIEYGPAPFITTEAEAVKFATETRGPALDLLMADMAQAADATVVVVTGDFNEPSVHDWTPEAVAAGQHPVAVKWPTTGRLVDAGFIDAYRAVHPDPVAKPAYTWTPSYEETATDDHPDRIDFVLVRGEGVSVTEAAIVGEDGPRSDIVVMPWPSDHRAVVAEIAF